jgi:transcriptional regulator with XRE-family HTH domain
VSAHLPPEVVASVRASTESGAAIARRLGIARQTVSKIRTGKTHQGEGRPTREATVRTVLSQPPDLSFAQISELTGIHRDTVRRIRLGLIYADVLPEIARMTLEESRRQCSGCVQWDGPVGPGGSDRYGSCKLGIPEATETQTWARGCGAYMARKEVAGGTTAPAQDEEPSGDATVSGSGS